MAPLFIGEGREVSAEEMAQRRINISKFIERQEVREKMKKNKLENIKKSLEFTFKPTINANTEALTERKNLTSKPFLERLRENHGKSQKENLRLQALESQGTFSFDFFSCPTCPLPP